ncbi:MAG: hypothetical protein FWG37_06100 [Clostridia bacterium]|nr:hypothetical protein [Clostridia bacterium]
MKKNLLAVALIVCGIIIAVLAAIQVFAGNTVVAWVLGVLLIGLGCWRYWISSALPDEKGASPEQGVQAGQSTEQEAAAHIKTQADPVQGVTVPSPDKATVTESQSPPAEPHAPQATESGSQESTFIDFHLSGVTRDNPDGESRQELIQKLNLREVPFDNSAPLDIRLVVSTDEDTEQIECRVNGRLIGYVPKDKKKAVAAAMTHKDTKVSSLNVLGGTNDRLIHGVAVVVQVAGD